MSELRVTTLKHAAAAADNITLDANGNVGIGTSSPASALSFGGAKGLNSTAGVPTLRLYDDGTNSFGIAGSSSGVSALDISCNFGGGNIRLFTGGTTASPIERMRIDSAGRVTMPYQPAFNALRTAGHTLNSVVLWNDVRTNVGSHYSAATGRFTAPVAGNYFFSVGAICGSSSPAASSGSVQIRLNGSSIKDGHWNITNDPWENVGATTVVTLNANDYIDVYVQGSSTAYMYGFNIFSNFNGYLIG